MHITPPATPSVNATMCVGSPANNMNETNNGFNSKLNNTTHLIHRNIRQIQQNQSLIGTAKSTPNIVGTNTLEVKKALQSQPQSQSLASNMLNNSNLSGTNTQQSMSTSLSVNPQYAMAQPRTVLPRPIVPANRTIFDKVLDFLIGEGPNNR